MLLKSGVCFGSFSADTSATGGDGKSIDKRALLVYEGDFESMEGPVKVTEEHLSKIMSNHNGMLSKLKRLASGEVAVKEYPPIQLDHSSSAMMTVGRLVGDLTLEKNEEGKSCLYGTVRVLGRENVEKVEDGRWSNLSIGADLESGKLNEVSITPFPAAANAQMLAKFSEIKVDKFTIETFKDGDGEWSYVVYDPAGKKVSSGSTWPSESEAIADAKEEVKERKRMLSKNTTAANAQMLAKLAGRIEYKDYVIETDFASESEAGKWYVAWVFDQRGNACEGEHSNKNFKTEAQAIAAAKKTIDRFGLSKGKDLADSNLAKYPQGTGNIKKSNHRGELIETVEHEDNDGESLGWTYRIGGTGGDISDYYPTEQQAIAAAKKAIDTNNFSKEDKPMDKEKLKKHLMDKEKMSAEDADKKLAAMSDDECKKLAEDMDKEKKEELSKLMADFRKETTLALTKTKAARIGAKLTALRVACKITPAEIKKMNVAELAAKSDEVVAAVLKSYEDRQPVIMTGVLGSTRDVNLAKVTKTAKERMLEKVSREEFSSIPKGTKLAEGDPVVKASEGGEAASDTVSIHVDTDPHTDLTSLWSALKKLAAEGKEDEALSLLGKYMEGAPAEEVSEKQMSALAESVIKMQNQFETITRLMA